jgi:tetraacyldisaccharide 4'-kinase
MNILMGAYSLVSRAACRAKYALVKAGVRNVYHAPLPVISVGNLTMGGSGKTPLVMEILTFLERRGVRPALVARGYKGSWEKLGGVVSDGTRYYGNWQEAGDEPCLIARRFPQAGVYVGKHRYRSCLAAAEAGFDAVVLDDGFQHIRLARDLDIVLHDPASRAPLREGLPSLRRAGILLLKMGSRADADAFAARFPTLDVFEYTVAVKGLSLLGDEKILSPAALSGRDISAFCGIARPGRFFELLRGLRLGPLVRTEYPDHYPYPEAALQKLSAEAAARRAEAFITTEKDAVKLLGRTAAFRGVPVYILRIGLDLPDAFFEKIAGVLPRNNEARLG